MQDKVNQIFKAIADPTRREILHALVLASVALPITDVAAKFDISRQGVTKHIRILEEASLVEISKKGRESMVFATPDSLKSVSEWLQFYEQFWDKTLKGLVDYLDDKK